MSSDPVVIIAAKRTPIGAFQGVLSPAMAPDLGAAAIAGAIADGGVEASQIDQVLMGCVLPAGLGQAPGATGRHWRRYPGWRGDDNCQQNVRIRYEDHHDGA